MANRRNSRESTFAGKKKLGRQEIYGAPSSEIPPPGTINADEDGKTSSVPNCELWRKSNLGTQMFTAVLYL